MEQQLELSDNRTTSSSQLDTVQPFTVEDSPAADADSVPLLQQDSGTLICTSLRRSPSVRSGHAAGAAADDVAAGKSSRRGVKRYDTKSFSNVNQLSHNRGVGATSDDRGTYSFTSTPSSTSTSSSSSSKNIKGTAVASISDPSVSADKVLNFGDKDYASVSHQSIKSPATFASGGSGSDSSSNSNSEDSRGACSNSHNSEDSGSDEGSIGGVGGLGEGGNGIYSNSNLASDALEQSDDFDSSQVTESEDRDDSARAMGTSDDQPSEDVGVESGEQTDSVFANLGETTEAEATSLTDGNQEKASAPRQSTRLNKNEIANLIEKAILDFCSSRTVETMRRMFAGVTNDSEALQRDGGRHDDKSTSTPHPVTGELVKEGVIIGDVDIFAPRMQREFILPVRDSLIATFLNEPGVFRAICYRTRCQIEVTRRLLNRKLCIGGRWQKYMIIRIVGPTYKCIENCDILLQKAVPAYKWRKTYHTAAVCRMYLREEVPDNAELYFNFQRTGGSSNRFGALKLESPFRQTAFRSCSVSPWKYGLFKVGKLAFSSPGTKMCMKHVYPSMGYTSTSSLEPEYQGVSANERIVSLHDQFQANRQAALTLRRALTIPVCR